jgi:hypothetical protein
VRQTLAALLPDLDLSGLVLDHGVVGHVLQLEQLYKQRQPACIAAALEHLREPEALAPPAHREIFDREVWPLPLGARSVIIIIAALSIALWAAIWLAVGVAARSVWS